jgi:hypothetical protein
MITKIILKRRSDKILIALGRHLSEVNIIVGQAFGNLAETC